MCSLGDDNIEDGTESFMNETEPKQLPVVCVKCRTTPPVILLRSKDAYCEDCFNVSVVHKFKALLGKSKLIRPNDKVLVSYKTDAPSTTLLHLIRNGLNLDTPKQLKFSPVIIFIEDNIGLALEERKRILESVKEHIKSFHFSSHIVSLASYILSDSTNFNFEDNSMIHLLSDTDQEKLGNVFSKKTISKTTRNDLLKIYERNLLISAAKHFGCKFVFTPELSSDIASNLLTNLSLGKGSHIPLDTGFCDDRDDAIKILRPLRSFDRTEVDFYNTLHSLTPIVVDAPKSDPYGSVQDLLVKFVNDLQVSYPATITTIVKTGDKLTPVRNGRKCTLCQVNIPHEIDVLSSTESTNFSRLISTTQLDNTKSRQERYLDTTKDFTTACNNEYCYSCAKIKDFIYMAEQ